MEEKIAEVETETTPVVPEEKQPEESSETTSEESKEDESGVPIKNRLAEANRKLRKAQEAQEKLVKPNNSQEEAIKLVQNLAQDEAKKIITPILVKDFLRDNPDAVDMIEDINKTSYSKP